MVKAQFSQSYSAVRSRIRRLPRMYDDTLTAVQKGDAYRLEKLFREGILARGLRLQPLTEMTVRKKYRRGYDSPETPLYGEGPNEDDSYSNMMEIVEEQTGKTKRWVVRPRDEEHHESELTLRSLFEVHEYGTVINNAFGLGITVRIPPRPAMRYAFRRLMRERDRRETSDQVRKAIARFVRENDRRALDRIKERAEQWLP